MIATVSFQAIGFTLFVHWYYMLLGKLSEIMLRLFSGFEGVIFFLLCGECTFIFLIIVFLFYYLIYFLNTESVF